MSFRNTVGLVAITVVCLPVPLLAQTYGIAEALPHFWAGALHLMTAPLPLAAVIGVAVTVACSSLTAARLSICAAGLSTFMVGAFDATTFAGAPSVAVVAIAGGVSVLGWNPPAWFSLLLGLAAGAVAATALTAVQHWDALLGLGVAVIATSGCAAKGLRYARTFVSLQDVVPIARRIIGAWGAAIAMLLARSS